MRPARQGGSGRREERHGSKRGAIGRPGPTAGQRNEEPALARRIATEPKGEPIAAHRLLAHTADVRAELAASDFAALCAEAVALVRELLVGASRVEPRTRKAIRLEGDDDAERFFRFVRELVYLADSETFLPAGCTLAGDEVELTGERFDPARHVAERQLKAVTRHRYRFERTPAGLVAELVFDL